MKLSNKFNVQNTGKYTALPIYSQDEILQTIELVAGIAVASQEQAQGVAQVTVGLQLIESVTQQNSAVAEESASASNEMSGMATELSDLIHRFKVKTQ